MLDSGCADYPVKSYSTNTTFWRHKTADILNVSQRQRATMKEKRIRDWQEPVSGVASVSVRFRSEEGGMRVKDRAKTNSD